MEIIIQTKKKQRFTTNMKSKAEKLRQYFDKTKVYVATTERQMEIKRQSRQNP